MNSWEWVFPEVKLKNKYAKPTTVLTDLFCINNISPKIGAKNHPKKSNCDITVSPGGSQTDSLGGGGGEETCLQPQTLLLGQVAIHD